MGSSPPPPSTGCCWWTRAPSSPRPGPCCSAWNSPRPWPTRRRPARSSTPSMPTSCSVRPPAPWGRCSPDFNLDLLLSFPAMHSRHWALRQRSFVELGGFDPVFGDACRLDLVLRLVRAPAAAACCTCPRCCWWRMFPAWPSTRRAGRAGAPPGGPWLPATVQAFMPGRYHIDYGHADQPRVSIVVAVRDHLPLLQRCVERAGEDPLCPLRVAPGRLREPGAGDPPVARRCRGAAERAGEGLALRRGVQLLGDGQRRGDGGGVRLPAAAEPRCAGGAGGLAGAVAQPRPAPGSGVVGAKVLDSMGCIEQAGVVLGLHDVAGRAFVGEEGDAPVT